jgi:RNA methyltransferase, TrmH family
VQLLRQLAERRSRRWEERSFVVEGPKLIDGALAAGADIQAVYLDAGGSTELHRRLAERGEACGAKVFELQSGVLARACNAVTPQPIAAIVTMVDGPMAALPGIDGEAPMLGVVCVEIQDPGNAGTVLRSAGAAGAGAVIFTAGSVDVYNPKSVRASAGAVFTVPVVAGDVTAEDALDQLGSFGLTRIGTSPRHGCDYAEMDLTGRTALVLGNESHGLTTALARRLDAHVTIPMSGGAESLNVATTASILCFESARQRRTRRPGPGPGGEGTL